MNSRTQAEIDRVINVIEDATMELKLVTYLSTYMTQMPQNVLSKFNTQTKQAISNLMDIERVYDYKIKNGEMNQQTISLAEKIKELVRQILYLFKKNGYLNDDLFFELEPNKRMLGFLKTFQELAEVWSDKLHTTVEEEQIKNDQKNEAAARDKKASADVKALQRELASERSIREREVSLREDALNKLKEELTNLQRSTQAELSEFNQTMKDREITEHTEFKNKKEKLINEIQLTRQQI